MFQVDNELDLPRDVIQRELLGQLIGRQSLVIENYKRLILFLPEEIKIQGCTYFMTIKGDALRITYFNQETMVIEGEIGEISFL